MTELAYQWAFQIDQFAARLENLLMAGVALNTVLILLLAILVLLRLRRNTRLLRAFQQDRNFAETSRESLMEQARERVGQLLPAALGRGVIALNRTFLRSDLREHIVSLSRKGFAAADIARACSIPESDVNVLLGFARLQK
jgi:biopolymer transport protein ExbB/TolQ